MRHDDRVVDVVLSALEPTLTKWLAKFNVEYGASLRRTVKQTIRYEDNPTRIVLDLCDHGWRTEYCEVSEFVNVESIRDEALCAAERDWITKNSLRPCRNVGNVVDYNHFGIDKRGTIVEVTDTGKYVISPEDEPEVKHYVNFERLDS